MARVERQLGELFPRAGFIVARRSIPNERVLAFCNDRGTAEQRMKDGRHALKWTRLACMRLTANRVRLQLQAAACNLAGFTRTPATPDAIETWSPTSLQGRRARTGPRPPLHARCGVLQLAEAVPPRKVSAGVLGLINGLRGPAVGAVSA